MPRATVSDEPVRHNLRTAPPDGYVVLKQMSWGEWLARRDMGMKMAMEAGGKRGDQKIDIDMVQAQVTRYEFQKCIVEHNLEDHQGRTLNLGRQQDFDKLAPRIASEIESLIREMHEWEEGEEEALFPGDQGDSDSESGTESW